MTDSEWRIWLTAEQAEGQRYAVVTPNPDAGSFDADVLDTTGNRYVHLRGYRTVALPNAVDAEPVEKPAGRHGAASCCGLIPVTIC